jgi:hypothetical protein
MIDPKPTKNLYFGVKSNKQLKVDEKSSKVDEKLIKEPKRNGEPSKEPKVDFRVQLTTNRKFTSRYEMFACLRAEIEKLQFVVVVAKLKYKILISLKISITATIIIFY